MYSGSFLEHSHFQRNSHIFKTAAIQEKNMYVSCKEIYLVGYNAAQTVESQPTFQRNTPSIFLLGFHLADISSKFLQNVGSLSPYSTVPCIPEDKTLQPLLRELQHKT
jgi:hypothetical protein